MNPPQTATSWDAGHISRFQNLENHFSFKLENWKLQVVFVQKRVNGDWNCTVSAQLHSFIQTPVFSEKDETSRGDIMFPHRLLHRPLSKRILQLIEVCFPHDSFGHFSESELCRLKLWITTDHKSSQSFTVYDCFLFSSASIIITSLSHWAFQFIKPSPRWDDINPSLCRFYLPLQNFICLLRVQTCWNWSQLLTGWQLWFIRHLE